MGTMYDAYIVQRTQIYLEERQLAELRALARASGRTLSDVIRDAVDDKLARPEEAMEFDLALEQVMGIWSRRADLEPADELVRRLRRDRRGRP